MRTSLTWRHVGQQEQITKILIIASSRRFEAHSCEHFVPDTRFTHQRARVSTREHVHNEILAMLF